MWKNSPISNLFGPSPFRGLQEHMKAVAECAEHLLPLFEALDRGDTEAAAGHQEAIMVLEKRADDIKNQLRTQLPKSLFLPVDRRDLLDQLNAQDSIADTAQDVADLLIVRGMTVPPFLHDLVAPFVARNVDAVRQCSAVVGELDELVAAGFRGKEVERVEVMIDQLSEIEGEADTMEADLIGRLFLHEEDTSPLTAVYWARLIEMIGDVADYAEDVGDRLRLLIAR